MTKLMLNPTRNPFSREIDRMFSNFFGPENRCHSGNCVDFRPAVDIEETADNVTLTFAVPGIDKSDIKVVIEDHTLTVSGERKNVHKDENVRRVVSEISFGAFSRSFTLPDNIDTEKVSADYKNGLLNIKLDRV